MITITLAPAALVLAALQEPGATGAERLEACSARSAALARFHARYDVELSGREVEPWLGWLEIAYAAPDRGAVRMHAGELVFEVYLGPGGIHTLLPDEDGALRW